MEISPASILARMFLSGTLAVAAISFLGAVRGQRRACSATPPPDAPVLAWRLRTPEVERLRGFLDDARRVLPHGAAVGFASADGPLEAALIRRFWAAYLAPDLNLRNEDAADIRPHDVLAYGVRLDRPGVSLVRPLQGGGLYRIGPP